MSLSLILISASVSGEEYQLGFTEESHLTLIYEYNKIDKDLLEYLSESTGDDSYESLAETDEGAQFKIIISTIDDEKDYWKIIASIYIGEDLNQQGSDIESKVYKNPDKLADKILLDEEDDISSIYFLPVDSEEYLEDFEGEIKGDERYLSAEYILDVDKRELTFDFTPYGYPDKIILEYNEIGVQESLEILCDGELAFKLELIEYYEDHKSIIFSVTIIIIAIISILSVYGIIIKKRKERPLPDPKNRIKKMLKYIK